MALRPVDAWSARTIQNQVVHAVYTNALPETRATGPSRSPVYFRRAKPISTW